MLLASIIPATVRRAATSAAPRASALALPTFASTSSRAYPTRTMSSQPQQQQHNYAPRAGFDASGASGLYHSARPDYPTGAIKSILNAATTSSSGSPISLLEIGSGTGISTQSLLQGCAEEKVTVQRYLAVEPSPGMREDWAKHINRDFVPKLPRGLLAEGADVACVDGTFENVSEALAGGKEEGIYDLVLIAQAWHWCQDIPGSLNAIAKALKKGGYLALVWNMEDQSEETGAKWVKEARTMYEKFEDGTPQYRHRYWASMYKEPALNDQYEVVPAEHFSRKLPTTVDGVKKRVLSKSYISVLPQDKQDELMKSIEGIFDKSSDAEIQRVWIDQGKGVFEYPYQTELLLFKKK